ncbi:MAG: methyl-accepting chemotaxis protein [Thermoflexaceae bacterium]|nr:methyl-accepting chemotaxis protein [Thermoflexaceae bacterium]
MKMRGKMLFLSILPLVVLGAATIILSASKIDNVVSDAVSNGLHSTAISIRDTLDYSDSGVYSVDSNGNLLKGAFNVTENTQIADEVKDATDTEITIFFGDTRYMTSVINDSGERVLGTKAGDKVIEEVLKNGNTYFAENVDVVGTAFYAYYVPLYDDSSTQPVGMVFAGRSQQAVRHEIAAIISVLTGIMLVVMVICGVVIFLVVNNMVKGLYNGSDTLKAVADGNLAVSVDENAKKRKDEVGNINRAIAQLREELHGIISGIKEQCNRLNEAAAYLHERTMYTSENIEQVERAVNDIAQGATGQASETQNATENVIEIGDMIEKTTLEVENLDQNAQAMKQMGQDASDTLQKLNEINRQASDSIDEIYIQTNTTNQSAQKIREVTGLITSIAEETNLLSLNASIEAARAGEQGRGFAVVAAQIQKLAEQSNESAQQIQEIVVSLINDSDKAVETMQYVKEIMDKQSQHVAETDHKFEQVMKGLDTAIDEVEVIRQHTEKMDKARVSVVDVLQNLSAIAEENAASTQETSASVSEVSAIVSEISDCSNNLKQIADNINQDISVFKEE